jgi:hypothetical protein
VHPPHNQGAAGSSPGPTNKKAYMSLIQTYRLFLLYINLTILKQFWIYSDIPENKVIFNDEEVLFFKSEDHNDLAGKIDWAITNIHLMNERSVKAYEKVLNVYRYEKISLEYQNLYNSLL